MEEAKQSKLEKHANDVLEMLESSMINGAVPSRFLYNKEGIEETKMISQDAQLDKMYKADYITLQSRFAADVIALGRDICGISDKSKDLEYQKRRSRLQDGLLELNAWIHQSVRL
jgi:hypothetical protein